MSFTSVLYEIYEFLYEENISSFSEYLLCKKYSNLAVIIFNRSF